MKSIEVFRLLCLVCSGLAGASDELPPVEQDTVFLRQGDRLIGKLAGIDEQSIRLRRLLPPLPGASADAEPVFASVAISRSHVDRVEFSRNEAQQLMLRNAPVANIPEVEALWRQARVWLTVAKSPAGEIGFAYGDLLLRIGDVVSIQKALDLFTTIEKEAWSDSDRVRARQGRLRAMLAAGMLQETIAEAKAMERVSEDPAVLIEPKFVLANAAEKALRKLVEDNPRWEEDAFARPDHERLYHEALDLYLYPALFFGSETEVAARGLWSALELSRFAGDLRQAIETSRDLIEIYPATSYARKAQDFLNASPMSQTKLHDEREANP
jgi:hypothetical protein